MTLYAQTWKWDIGLIQRNKPDLIAPKLGDVYRVPGGILWISGLTRKNTHYYVVWDARFCVCCTGIVGGRHEKVPISLLEGAEFVCNTTSTGLAPPEMMVDCQNHEVYCKHKSDDLKGWPISEDFSGTRHLGLLARCGVRSQQNQKGQYPQTEP